MDGIGRESSAQEGESGFQGGGGGGNGSVARRPRAATWAEALLRRRTSSTSYIAELDGLRFIAVAWVIAFHLDAYVVGKLHGGLAPAGMLHELMAAGHVGVPLFFTLSGFLLALPVAQHRLRDAPPVPLRKYFLRRLTRLEPPYVACMVILAAGALLLGGSPAGIGAHLAASLGYVHGLVYGEPSSINVVAWSLEVEVQFYLLMPLLGALLFRLPAWPRRLLLLGVMAAAPPIAARFGLSVYSLPVAADDIAAGILLADLRACGQRGLSPRSWDAVGAAALLGLPLTVAGSGHAHGGWSALAFLGCAGVLWGSALPRVLALPFFSLIGGACYSLYLWHYAAISLAGRFTARMATGTYGGDILLQSALLLPVVLIVGGIAFVLIERPCMDPKWPARVMARLRGGGSITRHDAG